MKMYNDFITESNKFKEFDFVKRKSDGVVGVVKYISSYSNGISRFMKYSVYFGYENNWEYSKQHRYLAKELEKPTKADIELYKKEIELHKISKKYNL